MTASLSMFCGPTGSKELVVEPLVEMCYGASDDAKPAEEKQSVARWRQPAALLAFAKKHLPDYLKPQNYKNFTRGEALENAMKALGREPLQTEYHKPLSQFFAGLNKKILAEGVPAKFPDVTPAAAPTELFRRLRSVQPYAKPQSPVPYVHGTPHAGVVHDPYYGSVPYSGRVSPQPFFARYRTTENQLYGPDYHLDNNMAGMAWHAIPEKLRQYKTYTYETPVTPANEFLGYGLSTPGGETYWGLPKTKAWQNVFGGKHGLLKELMPSPKSQTVRDPSIIEDTIQQARKYLDAMQKQAEEKQSMSRWPPFAAPVKQSALAPGIELQDHQQRIADRITGEDPRLLVYHGLGSGKSLSALAAAEQAKAEDGGEYGVVVPASLKGNFEKEIAKFTNSSPEVMSYTGLGMGKDFATNPDTLIMDEAARLRNPTAASTAAAMRAAQKAKRLVLLTGTPITNEPSDIASLLSMLNNEQITPQQFDQQFVSEKKIRPGLLGWLRGAKSGIKPVIKNEDKLRELLRGKVDYLPSKTPEGVNVNEQVVKVPLSAAQQKIQKAIRTKIPPGFLWKLDKEFPLSRDELAKLNSFMTGLRQVSLSTQPFRADKDMYRSFEQSSKLQKAMADLQETLKSDPRKKAIIYSNFIDAGLKPYAAALEKNKIPHAFFHGGVPVKTRQQALKAYNEGKLKALLLGPAAAEGISTKGTSLIQLLDPHWNEARTQQARGRGLRFDSHDGLPEELRNVAVRRYLSASDEPGLVGKYILSRKRERTGDEVLERLTAEKEQFNDTFRQLLREVGQEKQSDAKPKKKPVPEFKPDFTPEQLEAMGVYDSLYRGIGPRLASLGEWKPEWVNPVDPKGWAQWYKRYSGGRRLGDEDERQIKRWANFKSRHGGPFVKNPTPRRGWALQNWGVDPSLLVPEEESDKIRTMLRDYAVKQTAKHVANTSAEK